MTQCMKKPINPFHLQPLLMVCAENGYLDRVKELVDNGADPRFNDSSPLFLAAKNGHTNIVEFLLPLSDPTTRHAQALRFAVQGGHIRCAELLLQSASEHYDPKDLLAPLKSAVAQQHQSLCETLYPLASSSVPATQAGLLFASFVQLGWHNLAVSVFPRVERSDYQRSLIPIVRKGYVDLFEKIWDKCVVTYNEDDALIKAAEFNHSPIVNKLIPLASDENLQRAIEKAANNGHGDIVRLLLPTVSTFSNALEKTTNPDFLTKCIMEYEDLKTRERLQNALSDHSDTFQRKRKM